MKVYGDLFVRGGTERLDRFSATLENHLVNGWSRNHEREAEVRSAALGPLYCYSCTRLKSRPSGDLWMAMHSQGYLYVSNILAHEFPSLTYDQYNAILSDFCKHCARPAADEAGVSLELGNQDPQLEEFISPTAAGILRAFSAGANRAVSHPLDRKRWNAFLLAAHRENAELSPDLLERWLVEEEKWPEDKARALSVEYEHARDLLNTYESLPA